MQLHKCSLFGSQHNLMVFMKILKYSLWLRRKVNINCKYVIWPSPFRIYFPCWYHTFTFSSSQIYIPNLPLLSLLYFCKIRKILRRIELMFSWLKKLPTICWLIQCCYKNGKTNVSFTQNCTWNDLTEERIFVSRTKPQGALVTGLNIASTWEAQTTAMSKWRW